MKPDSLARLSWRNNLRPLHFVEGSKEYPSLLRFLLVLVLGLFIPSLRAAEVLAPDEVARRIAKLESDLRSLETNVLAGVRAAGARLKEELKAGQKGSDEVAEVLRVRRIQLLDAAGKVRMVLGTLPNGAVGLFAPNSETPQLVLGITPAGEPVLELTDSKTSHRATLSVQPDKAGLVLISQGKTSADLHVTRDSGMIGMSMPEAGCVGALQLVPDRAGLTVAKSGHQVIVSGGRDGAGLFATGKAPDGEPNPMATISFIRGVGAGIDLRDDQGRRNGMTTQR
jgi:hypothetical protein